MSMQLVKIITCPYCQGKGVCTECEEGKLKLEQRIQTREDFWNVQVGEPQTCKCGKVFIKTEDECNICRECNVCDTLGILAAGLMSLAVLIGVPWGLVYFFAPGQR